MIASTRAVLWAAAALVAIAIAAPCASASAQRPSVAVALEGCETSPVDLDALLPIVSAELADARVDVRALDATAATTSVHVTLACEDVLVAHLVAIDSATEKQTQRDVVLGDVPDRLLARTLALAVAELLRASWAELAVIAPAPEDTDEEVHLRAVTLDRIDALRAPIAETPAAEVALRLGLGARWYERFASGAAGLFVGLALEPRGVPIAATVDVGAEAGLVDVSSGTVSLVHVLASVALSLVGRFGRVTLTSGAFARGGPLFVDASLDAPFAARRDVLAALVAGGRLTVEVSVDAGWSTAIELEVGAPLVAAQVFAGVEPAGGIDGLCLGASFVAAGDL